MKLHTILPSLILGVSVAGITFTGAHATIDFCVMVRNTPDGFLALREGPGTRFRIKEKLHPSEFLMADTSSCWSGVCDETGQWMYINFVPRLDGRVDKATHFTQGWVARKFTTQVPMERCDDGTR